MGTTVSTKTNNRLDQVCAEILRTGPEFLRRIELRDLKFPSIPIQDQMVRGILAQEETVSDIGGLAALRVSAMLIAGHRRFTEDRDLELLIDGAQYGLPARGFEDKVIAAAFFALGTVVPGLEHDHPRRIGALKLLNRYRDWDPEYHGQITYVAAMWALSEIQPKNGKQLKPKRRASK